MPSLLQKDARSEVHRKLLGQDKVFCKSQFSVNSVVVEVKSLCTVVGQILLDQTLVKYIVDKGLYQTVSEI